MTDYTSCPRRTRQAAPHSQPSYCSTRSLRAASSPASLGAWSPASQPSPLRVLRGALCSTLLCPIPHLYGTWKKSRLENSGYPCPRNTRRSRARQSSRGARPRYKMKRLHCHCFESSSRTHIRQTTSSGRFHDGADTSARAAMRSPCYNWKEIIRPR